MACRIVRRRRAPSRARVGPDEAILERFEPGLIEVDLYSMRKAVDATETKQDLLSSILQRYD